VSNRKKLPREVPAGVAAMAKTARCSDCPARGQARYSAGQWSVTLLHIPACPGYRGVTATLHADARESVARAAEQSGTELVYEVLSDAQGVVTGSGLVSAGGGLA
jgi:hypothetical protein